MSILTSTFQSWEKILHKRKPLFNLYGMIYSKVLNKEFFLGGFCAKDRIVNIGCGAVPFTAIYLSQKIGAKVVALDKDADALEKAHYSLRKYGLEKNIELVEADATKYVPRYYTGALVALQAEPKKKILENLLSNGEKGASLIFRQPRDIFTSQYAHLPLDKYPPDSEVIHSMKTIGKSILYLKRD